MKNVIAVVTGLILGAALMAGHYEKPGVAQDRSTVVVGHRVAPNGQQMVSFADGHVITVLQF
jgi:prepilin-type processing-associated H-X9-DG protein